MERFELKEDRGKKRKAASLEVEEKKVVVKQVPAPVIAQPVVEKEKKIENDAAQNGKANSG